MVELKGTEKQVKWANDIRKDLVRQVQELKQEINKGNVGKNTVLTHYKEELRAINPKLSSFNEALEILIGIMDKCISNIENEESAKKFIDVHQSLKLYDANFHEYVVKKFI
jgi:hypothetical protein